MSAGRDLSQLADAVDHVARLGLVSPHTCGRLRAAAAALRTGEGVARERDALRAEVERLRRQGGPSSRLPAVASPWGG